MTIEAFKSSLSAPEPPDNLPRTLQALWYDAKDDWQTAHSIVQDMGSEDASWIHAYLHRKEGDHGNAGYWYRRAGKQMPKNALSEEWDEIVARLLARPDAR